MHPATRHPVRSGPGRRPTILATALLAALALLVAGCTQQSAGIYAPPYAQGPWSSPQTPPNAKELQLARAPFSVQLTRYADARLPESLAATTPEQRYYDYNPEELLQGSQVFIPATLEKYLAYRPHMPSHYHVETELRRLTTLIKKGTLFSGSWGRYAVDMEMLVTIRHPGRSAIITQRIFNANLEQPRPGNNGRSPTKEADRAAMVALSNQAVRTIAQNIGATIYRYNANLLREKTPAEQQAAEKTRFKPTPMTIDTLPR